MTRLEGNEGTTQHGEVAVEIEIARTGGVFFEERVANPMVAAFAASPMTSDQAGKSLGALRHEGAHIGVGRLLAFAHLATPGGMRSLGDDHQAAHMRQAAGEWLDGENLNASVFYPTVAAVLGFAGKRGEPASTMRRASVSAVGWLPLSWNRASPLFSTTHWMFSRSQCRASPVTTAP